MKRHYIMLITAITISSLQPMFAYDTGSLSCSEIGEFAAAVVAGKENGATLKEALAAVTKRTEGYPKDRKVLASLARQIYTAPWANKLSQEGARMAFAADCEAQR